MSYEVWGDNDDDRFEAAREEGWLDPTDLSRALIDVMNERDRQWNEEGWTPKHDDKHDRGELARAAICYADPLNTERETPPAKWPWDPSWWKPKDRRRDLVRAAALILAEIERLDRLAAKAGPDA